MEIGTVEFVSERNGPVNHAVFSCQTSDRRHCLRFGIPNRIAVPRPSGIYRVFRDSRASSGRFSSPVVAPTSNETVSHDNVRSSRARLRLRRRTKKRFPALCPDSKNDGLVVTRHDRFFFFSTRRPSTFGRGGPHASFGKHERTSTTVILSSVHYSFVLAGAARTGAAADKSDLSDFTEGAHGLLSAEIVSRTRVSQTACRDGLYRVCDYYLSRKRHVADLDRIPWSAHGLAEGSCLPTDRGVHTSRR